MKWFVLVILSLLLLSCSNKNEYLELKNLEDVTWSKLQKQSQILSIYAVNNDKANYEAALKELKNLEDNLSIIHEKLDEQRIY
jgi:outer membrane biogenesis lipoprotein LolB